MYTCTLNLAIDLFMETETLTPFTVNRTREDDIQANGKGVNVSLVLKELHIPSTALGFKAGFTGQYIEDFLHEKEIETNFIEATGFTRINVFTQVVKSQEEFKLVNRGPVISSEKKEAFLDRISQLEAGDYLCVSGSLPRGISATIFPEIAQLCTQKEVKLILDTSYVEVLECLPYQPFLLKPNEEELAAWFDVVLKTKEECLAYGKKLIEMGAQHVLLSLGSEGAYSISRDQVLYGNSPKGQVVNTACAGDTLLGTFLAGVLNKDSVEETLKKSIAAGSSTAFRQGLTDFSDVADLADQIYIQKVAES